MARDRKVAHAYPGGPISVISLAAPRVGDHKFRRVHQRLKASGRSRHLRLIASGDVAHPCRSLECPNKHCLESRSSHMWDSAGA